MFIKKLLGNRGRTTEQQRHFRSYARLRHLTAETDNPLLFIIDYRHAKMIMCFYSVHFLLCKNRFRLLITASTVILYQARTGLLLFSRASITTFL